MYRHAAKSAAHPNSSLKTPSLASRHSRERSGGCSEPSCGEPLPLETELRLGRTFTAEIESVTSVHRGAFRLVSRPLLGVTLLGQTGALRLGVVLLRLQRPCGSRFLPKEV